MAATAVGSPSLVAGSAPASIYVGDLHHSVTDGQLYDAFSAFRSLASVRVCRDSSTGRSLCYGYVNFASLQDALNAVQVKNLSLLNGKTIRVMWSARDSDARRKGYGNVFVKNLSETINSLKLKEMFARFGNILSCKVAESEDGKSRGYGFVQFESEDSAIAAIDSLNGTLVDGKQLYVGKFLSKNERALSCADMNYTNLYVKNLDPNVSEEELQEMFSKFGKIVSLAIAKDQNGASKGFGFVNYECSDDARHAKDAMNGLELGSKCLYVARAQKKVEREQLLRRQYEEKRREQLMKFMGSNVYIKNLNDDVTDDELRELFSQCGTITSSKLMRDNKGLSKGFGFVCFSVPEEASKAVNTFHGQMLHKKPLYVALAQRKEERQAQLQLQHAQRMAGIMSSSAPVVPKGYPPVLFPGSSIVSQTPLQQPLMYQPILGGMMPDLRCNGFDLMNNRLAPQSTCVPMISYGAMRQKRQTRARMNGSMLMPNGGPVRPSALLREPFNQQRAGLNHTHSDRQLSKSSSSMSSGSSNSTGNEQEILSRMLAAANPQQQKQILGERLYPLVETQKYELAAKITGMLLEMDNEELLVLLESPESLAAKVEEAVQVLQLSKNKIAGNDGGSSGIRPSNYRLSAAEVAVI